MKTLIPAPIISVVANHLAGIKTHGGLNSLFMYADAPGEPPDENKVVKCLEWLRRTNKETDDPLAVLGKLIEEEMEYSEDCAPARYATPNTETPVFQERLTKLFEKNGLLYLTGGHVKTSRLLKKFAA